MRRFLLLLPLAATLFTIGCDDGDNWTPRHQINYVQSLVTDHPATVSDFQTFISDIEQGVWDLDNWITYRNGEIWNTSFSGFINTAFGKGSQFLNLIFYADGTCRQCYLYAPAPYNNIPYPFLYTTLLWSYDSENLTISLTNSEYQAQGSPYAQTTLRLLYYRYGEFVMDGLQPSPEPLNGYKIRYIGTVQSNAIRLDYESRYKDANIFATLNGESYR